MLRVGVIGCGRWGVNHVRSYSKIKDCELVGISDISDNAARIAEEHGVGFFPDAEELIKKADAVSVVTPTDTHYEIVRKCLEMGKHVLVEKPITLDYKSSEELVSLAERKKLVLAVGHLYRFNSSVIQLKDMIKSLGDINHISCRYIHSTKPPRKDSGVIFNFSSHLFDILYFLLERDPEKIFCKRVNYLDGEREDYSDIVLDYGDFSATLESSWLHPLKRRDIWVIGSKSKVYADFLNQRIERHQIEITPGKSVNSGVSVIEKKNDPLGDEIRHFLGCASDGKTPVNSGKEGLKVIRLCEMALKSSKEGVEIRL